MANQPAEEDGELAVELPAASVAGSLALPMPLRRAESTAAKTSSSDISATGLSAQVSASEPLMILGSTSAGSQSAG